MIVVTLTDCPPKLRGDLSKWLMEINTGVYVGKLSARVREELWSRICENISHGRATMVYSANNEQGMEFRIHNTSWEPVDYEGLTLIRRPAKPSVENPKYDQPSKARTWQKLNSMNAGKAKKKQQEGYVVIDLETTGLQKETDEIIELAAVRVIDHKIAGEFSVLIRTEKKLSNEITELTGIRQEMLEESGLPLAEAIEQFCGFIGSSAMVGHNISFDRVFLNRACAKLGRDLIHNIGKDTLSMARRCVKEVPDYKLATLAKHFGIPIEEKHRALADCKTTFLLYEKLNEIQG